MLPALIDAALDGWMGGWIWLMKISCRTAAG